MVFAVDREYAASGSYRRDWSFAVYVAITRWPLGRLANAVHSEGDDLRPMVICFPVLVSMMHGALQSSDRRAVETAITLGVSIPRVAATMIWETRFPLLAAIIAGFSRIVTEVGCSMMVGGNIMGVTRNIPTAIAMESSKGAFAQGVALGIVLLSLALALNFFLSSMRGKGYLRT